VSAQKTRFISGARIITTAPRRRRVQVKEANDTNLGSISILRRVLRCAGCAAPPLLRGEPPRAKEQRQVDQERDDIDAGRPALKRLDMAAKVTLSRR
jgi:hypothetical protein